MVSLAKPQSAFERIVIDHIELWLSALGLVFIWIIPQLLTPVTDDRWRTTAITAIAVGLVHALIFWAVRHRRQKIKAEAQAVVERENARLEERVAERTDQLRGLAAELGMAEQRERHRLAVVLHEQLQQLLFSIQMRVQAVSREPSRDEAATELGTIAGLLSEAIASTRNLSLELSPPVLAGEGLGQALQWLAVHMSETHQLDVRFDDRSRDSRVDEAIRVLVFQVVRELLGAAGHGAVHVLLEDGAESVSVDIRGLTAHSGAQADADAGAIDLARVRERLYFVGGRVEEKYEPARYAIIAPKAAQAPHN